jgi:hypothetical protein
MEKAQVGVWVALPLVGLIPLFLFVGGPFVLVLIGFSLLALVIMTVIVSSANRTDHV